ncbi:hypothetical protein P3T76_000290 [Phytophthora citrophthora]|uniref:EF-hand domain-containing protein n=1 Tax=Phytophthora citrophthora TaxID=4793 RepID=A0AAD9H0Z0_9STRA|nr:hypothetical protein P3T76_000290 [Phytophthora citrophthora]
MKESAVWRVSSRAMVVLRPDSSILKPGVRERQRELETVITKYELLLAIGRARNPDFESLDLPQLNVVSTWFDCSELHGKSIKAGNNLSNPEIIVKIIPPLVRQKRCGLLWKRCLRKRESCTRQVSDNTPSTFAILNLPEVSKSTLAVQGEVRVLFEKGELLDFCRDHSSAMAAYAEAIRLCYNIEDEATEAILTSKLRKLQRQADATERVESLLHQLASDGDSDEESERHRLKMAFAKVADKDGFMGRNQLQSLALELQMPDALSSEEIDEIWRQVLSSNKSVKSDSGISTSVRRISFEMFWSWWVSDTMYDLIKNNDVL